MTDADLINALRSGARNMRDMMPVVSTVMEKAAEQIQKFTDAEELHRMQMAAVMTATVQNTDKTVKDRITKDHPYWTQAYEDVCRAVDREMSLRKELNKQHQNQNEK